MSTGTVSLSGVLSLHEEGLKEAQRHKWIESQKHGRDLGLNAIQQWYRDYWIPYCRCKRLEHVQGSQRWQEFESQDFGRIYARLIEGDLLVDRILDRVYIGMENLEIINWVLDWNLSIDRTIEILAQLDVNGARLEPVALD